ncbi:hypothetical protein HYC85_016847 [Camellia sinensis]|uniref:Uncharacterized protein n=1 Tax=Camellia sinensis TaxID=4442 RepID=A0A7J7H0T8_CAMSI|nr:hypothetical protein HYC85_016847 [Camellia sinensis]
MGGTLAWSGLKEVDIIVVVVLEASVCLALRILKLLLWRFGRASDGGGERGKEDLV